MLVLNLPDHREQVLEAARQQSFRLEISTALNRERLAGTCLPVGENRAVVAHQALIYDSSTHLLKYLDLGCLLTSHIVKSELLIAI